MSIFGVEASSAQSVMRLFSLVSETSNESHLSRWTDEGEGADIIEPPKRPTYRSSPSYKAANAKPWTCIECSYQNADLSTESCALCGRRRGLSTCSPFDAGNGVPSSPSQVLISNLSQESSESPISPQIRSFSALFSTLRQDRRNSNCSVTSQSSVATVKASNTAEEQFWRSRRPSQKHYQQHAIDEEVGSCQSGSSSADIENPQVGSARSIRGDIRFESNDSDGMVSRTSSTRFTRKKTSVSSKSISSRLSQCSHNSFSYPGPLNGVALQSPASHDSCRLAHGKVESYSNELTSSSPTSVTSKLFLDPETAEDAVVVKASNIPRTTLQTDETTTVSSEISTFANEVRLPTDSRNLSTRNLLIIISISCLAIAATVVLVLFKTLPASSSADPIKISNVTSFPDNSLVPSQTPISTPPDQSKPFRPTEGVGVLQTEFTQLGHTIYGSAPNDQLGTYVELANQGTIMALSDNSGLVRVYQLEDYQWRQIGRDLLPGFFVAVPYMYPISLSETTGETLAILYDGAAYVYTREGSFWHQRGTSITTSIQNLGPKLSISADGSILAVATPNNGFEAGKVQVYTFDESLGRQGDWKSLGAQLEGYSNQTGISMELSADGRTLALGTWETTTGSGYAPLFSSHKIQVHNLSDLNSWDRLGQPLSLDNVDSESTVSVALADNGRHMAACTISYCRVFNVTQEGWKQLGKDVQGGRAATLSSDGKSIIVGNDDTVQVYSLSDEGFWIVVGDVSGLRVGDISMSGSVLAVGSPFDSTSGTLSGSVRTFRL